MAADDALLESAGRLDQTTLRLYAWDQPTLSLGYFQSSRDREEHRASRDCPMVRRATGGGAILHDLELTYSYTLPRDAALAGHAPELYDAFHDSLAEALGFLKVPASRAHESRRTNGNEPFLCFQRIGAGDVVLVGHKIGGSAQRRTGRALLQHGSLLLSQSTLAPELPGVEQLSGHIVSRDELITAWLPRLGTALDAEFHSGDWTESELSALEMRVSTRFDDAAWTHRR